MKRKIKMGMAGGGPGSVIGAVHRAAARLDGKIDLIGGAFSRDRDKTLAQGSELFLPEYRCYRSYDEMMEFENELPPEERIDCITIVAPDAIHYDIATKALKSGFHVICEKPMALSLEDARALADQVRESGLIFALACNYNGYSMLRQARAMIQDGEIGEITSVTVEYPQGRLDGAAENLVEYVTGHPITEVCADLLAAESRILSPGDNILTRFANGARGVLTGVRRENDLFLRIDGTLGTLEWRLASPDSLTVKRDGQPLQVFCRHQETVPAATSRTPAGYPEGFLEAFANVYTRFAEAVWAHVDGDRKFVPDFPNAADGFRGVAFVEAIVKSAGGDRKWTSLDS